MKVQGKRKDHDIVILGKSAVFTGVLKFNRTVRIQGILKGTIEASGALIVDKDAVVEADHIIVSALTVYGSVTGAVQAQDKVDMMSGSVVHGDVSAARLRIADGVLFEGQCRMTNVEKDIEIFSRSTEEIKAELQRSYGRA